MINLFSIKSKKVNVDVKGYYTDCAGECFASCSSGCSTACSGTCKYSCEAICYGSCGFFLKN